MGVFPCCRSPRTRECQSKVPGPFLKLVPCREDERTGRDRDWFHEFSHLFFHLVESNMIIREETFNKNIGTLKRNISSCLVFVHLDFDLFNGEMFHEEGSSDQVMN